MNTRIISAIALNELYRVIFNPVVIIVGVLLSGLTFINAAGGYENLIAIMAMGGADGFIKGFSQMWSKTNFFCGVMAAFLGVYTIAEDRFTSASNLLLTKPLYRRDLIIGKFAGLSTFIVIFVIFTMISNSIVLSYFYGSPQSMEQFILRIFTYTIVLSLDMILVLALMMFVGALFNDLLLAMAVTVTFVCYEWLWNYFAARISDIIQIPVTTYHLNAYITGGSGPYRGYDLFDTTTSFDVALPYISQGIWLMVFLIVAVLLITCFLYSRSDDV